jgi:hypothetical protein
MGGNEYKRIWVMVDLRDNNRPNDRIIDNYLPGLFYFKKNM